MFLFFFSKDSVYLEVPRGSEDMIISGEDILGRMYFLFPNRGMDRVEPKAVILGVQRKLANGILM